MVKSLFAISAALAATVAFAAQNDALLSFSTKGPDKYADGTTVLDGESYALVWTPKGSAGAVFAADGTVSGGKVVLKAPVAKNGRCPRVVFEIEASRMKSEFASGSWSVWLLDTRRWDAAGAVSLSGGAGSAVGVSAVNAANAVAGSSVKLASGSIAEAKSLAATTVSSATAIPSETPAPKVTAMQVRDGYVYLTVANTMPYLAYGLSSGTEPGEISERVGAPQNGDNGGEIILVAPAKDEGAFFRVGRR